MYMYEREYNKYYMYNYVYILIYVLSCHSHTYKDGNYFFFRIPYVFHLLYIEIDVYIFVIHFEI